MKNSIKKLDKQIIDEVLKSSLTPFQKGLAVHQIVFFELNNKKNDRA